jgi:HAD superfamily hydrolase (TIGR01509 family)
VKAGSKAPGNGQKLSLLNRQMKSTKNDYAAVIFDMDGLMVDTERSARRAWRNFLATWGNLPQGLDADTLYSRIIGLSVRDAEKVVYDLLGSDFPFDVVVAHEDQYIEEDITQDKERMIKKGLWELLDLIEERGLDKAVATSTVRDVALKRLSFLGLINRFQAIVGGDEVKEGKPKPAIYELAAERLGIKEKDRGRCIVLEDSEPGVQAGRAAQMVVIMVRDPEFAPPDRERDSSLLVNKIFGDLLEVRTFLEDELLRSDV